MAQVLSEFNVNISPQQYNNILSELESQGLGHPSGRLYHVAIQKDRGMEIIGVWESEKAFEDFTQSLFPILESRGISDKPNSYPVYRIEQ